MATKIDKKDTIDISDSIAHSIYTMIKRYDGIPPVIAIRDIIEEELNDWISECETEDAIARQERIDNTLTNEEMLSDY